MCTYDYQLRTWALTTDTSKFAHLKPNIKKLTSVPRKEKRYKLMKNRSTFKLVQIKKREKSSSYQHQVSRPNFGTGIFLSMTGEESLKLST